MPEYLPAYKRTLPLTLPRLEEELDILRSMHTYAIRHDDVFVLDELFCRIVPLEHRIMQWEEKTGAMPRVADSLVILDRALKWAWLAREEEKHVNGMYAGKLKEALAVLEDLHVFLASREEPKAREEFGVPEEIEEPPAEMRPVVTTPEVEEPATDERPPGMTRQEAEDLAATITARLPQAEVEVKTDDDTGAWVVEARNPRRGTSQTFASAQQFEDLMQAARR